MFLLMKQIQFKDKEQKDSPPAAECRQQKHRAGFSTNRSSGQVNFSASTLKHQVHSTFLVSINLLKSEF